MTDSGGIGIEGTQLPSTSEKIKLLMAVRRRADGSPWRGATDIRAGLLALPGGVVKVDLTVSMIAKVINGKQPNPGALLLAGLAALFEVPAEYLLPPVCDRAVDLTLKVHNELQALEAANQVPASAKDTVPVATASRDWTTWARDLTLGIKQIEGGIAEDLGIGAGQAEALLKLAGSRKASVSIAEMAGVCEFTQAHATRTADVFEAKGLLQPHPRLVGDKSNVRRLALTRHAREIVDRHTQPDAMAQKVLDSMSAEEFVAAEKMLAALTGRTPSAGGNGESPLGGDGGREPPKPRAARGVA